MPQKKKAKASTTPAQERYGGPGMGLTFPPYYRPTPSCKSGTTFFPTAEELGADEMRITFEQCQGLDLFVTELRLDTGALVALKAGVPEVIYDLTIDLVHTDHSATGYMMSQVNPRAGMVTHTPYDRGLMNECIAGVGVHWDGLFAWGAPDGVVTNVTKDAIWNRQSAWPDAANPRPATTPDELDAAFGKELRRVPAPKRKVTDLISKERLETAIPYDRFVPADVDRRHRRGFPRELVGRPAAPASSAPSATAKAGGANGKPRYERQQGGWFMRVSGEGPDRVQGKKRLPAGAKVVRS